MQNRRHRSALQIGAAIPTLQEGGAAMPDSINSCDDNDFETRTKLRASQLLIHFLRNDWDGIWETWKDVESESSFGELSSWYFVEYHLPTLRLMQQYLSPKEADELASRISQGVPKLLLQHEKPIS
jgi:hypothetical protein